MLHGYRVNYALFSMLLDILSLVGAILLAQHLRSTFSFGSFMAAPEAFPPFVVALILLIWNVFFVVFSVHVPEKNYRFILQVESVLVASFFSILTLAGTLFFSYRQVSRLLIIYFFFCSIGLMLGWRLAGYVAYSPLRLTRHLQTRPVIIIGSSEIALEAAERI